MVVCEQLAFYTPFYTHVNTHGVFLSVTDWSLRFDPAKMMLPPRANFFFGLTFDLENFPTSQVKGRILLEATPP